LLIAIACGIASARRLQRVGTGLGADVERWTAKLGGSRADSPLARLRTAARGDAAFDELVEALAGAPSRAVGIAELNDLVGELARELEVGAAVPRAAGRIALFSGVALAVAAVAAGLPAGGQSSLAPAAAAFGLGLVGALACAALGRAAEGRTRRQREAWEQLRRALERLLPPAP
jgi:hypothetical protein